MPEEIGQPPYAIPREFLKKLRELGFSWTIIAAMFKVSRWTVLRRVKAYGLENLAQFSNIGNQYHDMDQLRVMTDVLTDIFVGYICFMARRFPMRPPYILLYILYAMEQTGLLDLENQIHMFVLHWVFLKRINHSLHEWMDSFNNHPLSTEHNWTPNQLWINGMLREDNPLAAGGLDDDPTDIKFY